jgi:glycosidase
MRRPPRLLAAGLVLVLVTGACAGSASPSPAGSASPGPSASAGPSAGPSAGGSFGGGACAVPSPGSATDAWWRDRVFYQLFVRSFQDSDGDGIGDLRGVIDRLDYLNDGDPATTDDLGVTGLWLMPVFEARSYHGYDVVDYRAVERDYGTAGDLKALVDAAHARGIAVILDLVLNHTSAEHPWFVESRDPTSARADWYVWSESDPGFAGPNGEVVWHPLDDRWFYGYFWDGMPDANLRDPDVTAELHDVAADWIRDSGIDGYRLDAVKHYVEDGEEQVHTPETFAWARDFRSSVKAVRDDALLVGEIWDVSLLAATYVEEEAVDLAFEFELASGMVRAARLEDTSPILGLERQLLELYPGAEYATFLTNHDQNRVMSELSGDTGAARAAASLLLTGAGVPFVYYGEEIGLAGRKPDERIRVPMPWDGTAPAGGFSSATPWQPMGDDWPAVNVAAQADDEAALLDHYRELIGLRAAHPALRSAETHYLDTSDPMVHAALRVADDETLLVLVNLGATPARDVQLSLDASPMCDLASATLLWADDEPGGDAPLEPPTLVGTGGFADWAPIAELAPRGVTIIRLGS